MGVEPSPWVERFCGRRSVATAFEYCLFEVVDRVFLNSAHDSLVEQMV
jgi:hypothetical protein